MGISLRTVKQDRGEVRIPFGEEELVVGYARGVYKTAFLEEMTADDFSVVDLLERVALDTNIQDEAGAAVPLSRELWEELGFPTQRRIARAIQEQVFPNLTSRDSSTESG